MEKKHSAPLDRKAALLAGARAVAKASRRTQSAMEPDSRHHLTPTQAFYLQHIARMPHGITISDLAEHAKVTLAAASQMVTRLENEGYAKRRPSISDGRVVMVAASAYGRWVLSLMIRQLRRTEARWRAHLTPRTAITAIAHMTAIEHAQNTRTRADAARAFQRWWQRWWA